MKHMQPIENNSQLESYCADMVRAHDRNLYLLALFARPPQREGLLVIYALATELSHLRHMISEEMIGHIRYAWWREAIEGLSAGKTIPGHPVLEALQPLMPQLPQEQLMALVEAYAAPYPDAPQGEDDAIKALSMHWLATPDAQCKWQKAHAIITRHHKKHGRKKYNWLIVKLLFAGFV